MPRRPQPRTPAAPPVPGTAHLTLTPDGLHLRAANGTHLHLGTVRHLTLTTAAGFTLTLTPQTRSPSPSLVTIPGPEGRPRQFHPLSEGAPLSDYVAYVMSRPDVPLPVRLRDLKVHLRNTAATPAKNSTLVSALERDPRFMPAGERGFWTFTPEAFATLNAAEEQDGPHLSPDALQALFRLPTFEDLFVWTQFRVQHPDGRVATVQLPRLSALDDLPLTLQLVFQEPAPPAWSPRPHHPTDPLGGLQPGQRLTWQGAHPTPLWGSLLGTARAGQPITPECLSLEAPHGEDTTAAVDAINAALQQAFPSSFPIDDEDRA